MLRCGPSLRVFWAILDPIGPFVPSGPFWALCAILGPHCGSSGPFRALLFNLCLLGHSGPLGPFWSLRVISRPTLGQYVRSRPFWALIMGPSGPSWSNYALWAILGFLGPR